MLIAYYHCKPDMWDISGFLQCKITLKFRPMQNILQQLLRA